MGQVQSAFDPDKKQNTTLSVGNYHTPPFPSLYNPTLASTVQQRGWFLLTAEAIWKFTFFWTLILLGGIFAVSGCLAALNLFLSRTVLSARRPASPESGHRRDPSGTQATISSLHPELSRYKRRRRPALWLVLIIPVTMVIVASLVALVSGTVVGFALAAVYAAGGFSMSTWVPFLWAMIQVVVLIISSYSTLTRVL